MSKAVADIVIDRPADEVWAVIGRFDDIFWRDGVATCAVVDGIRTVTMSVRPDIAISQRLVEHDDTARTYSYGCHGFSKDMTVMLPDGRRFDPATMIGHHKATLAVAPIHADASHVTYSVEIDEGYDLMLTSTASGYQRALEDLKRNLEG